MIILYHSGGARDFQLLGPRYDRANLKNIIFNVQRLLRQRGYTNAAEILSSADFEVWDSTNFFSDEFSILYAEVPLNKYESLRIGRSGAKEDFTQIADVFTELGTFIRFIACELKLEKTSSNGEPYKLASGEILKLVNDYIGVHGGYLGDFTYRTHQEFYPQFCDLEVDPNDYKGTTRERFINIIKSCDRAAQAKIIRGITKKYPVGSQSQRTQALFDYFDSLASRLELKGGAAVSSPDPTIASDTLKRALDDAEALIRQRGAVSAVDRIHTALHSYLRAVCNKSSIDHEADASLTQLFKALREQHPALVDLGTRSEEIGKILRSCAAIMDALNTLRNRASLAHPNYQLLANEEAMLVVNITRTLLCYLDAKFASHARSTRNHAQLQ